MVYLGVALFAVFFLAWFGRNIFKYMYQKQNKTFNKVLWLVLLPVSLVGLVLLLVGGLVAF